MKKFVKIPFITGFITLLACLVFGYIFFNDLMTRSENQLHHLQQIHTNHSKKLEQYQEKSANQKLSENQKIQNKYITDLITSNIENTKREVLKAEEEIQRKKSNYILMWVLLTLIFGVSVFLLTLLFLWLIKEKNILKKMDAATFQFGLAAGFALFAIIFALDNDFKTGIIFAILACGGMISFAIMRQK